MLHLFDQKYSKNSNIVHLKKLEYREKVIFFLL